MSDEEKALISLNKEELKIVNSICVDKDPEEAIYFVNKILAPKLQKKVPCLAGEIMKKERT